MNLRHLVFLCFLVLRLDGAGVLTFRLPFFMDDDCTPHAWYMKPAFRKSTACGRRAYCRGGLSRGALQGLRPSLQIESVVPPWGWPLG